jgi:phosphatidylglycerophosphatase C
MPIAIFDLDGTITRHDTLFPLVMRHLARRPWRLLRLVLVIPALISYALTRDRGALKQSLLRATLRGTPRGELEALATGFVRDKIARGCFHDALATIRRHQEAGHQLVLMSASVDFYVPEFGRLLGFARTICTRVAWHGDLLDGTLTSENCRGEEKVRQLQALLADQPDAETFAYGNSASDLPHLEKVKHGLLVNGSGSARRSAAAAGVSCADWT